VNAGRRGRRRGKRRRRGKDSYLRPPAASCRTWRKDGEDPGKDLVCEWRRASGERERPCTYSVCLTQKHEHKAGEPFYVLTLISKTICVTCGVL
jgi:hypothetical protein